MDSLKASPVSSFIGVCIIVIYSLYTTSVIKTLPCNNDVMSVFSSNFIHVDLTHLITNIYALYELSRVERDIGYRKFTMLIIFLVVTNTILEVIAHKLYPSIPCSIGFSGVLYGVITYEYITTKQLNLYLVASILTRIILPHVINNSNNSGSGNNISVVGHLVGAISGIIGGLLYNKLIQKMK